MTGALIGPRQDVLLIFLPIWATLLIGALAAPGSELPPWGWLVFVVGIDVSHVYASLYRTYLDPQMRSARPDLLRLTPLAVGMACMALWGALGPGGFWRVMAYLAVFHFVRQAVGIGVLYRRRARVDMASLGARVERMLLYLVTLAPVLWWHAHPVEGMSWFVAGDFVAGLPGWVATAAVGLTMVVGLVHLPLRWREGGGLQGRDLWLLSTGLAWFVGMCWFPSDLSFTVTNVVAHGVPYVVLVWWVGRQQWQVNGAGPVRREWYFGAVWLFVGLLVALAVVEEVLWDWLVWREHAAFFGSLDLGVAAAAVAVPILAVPQVTHYVLDGFIWRRSPHNPPLPV